MSIYKKQNGMLILHLVARVKQHYRNAQYSQELAIYPEKAATLFHLSGHCLLPKDYHAFL
jgi:hypothetical protein